MADEHGNVVHLGERDCSIQRKNQKILEETPSSFIDDKLRKKMGKVAVNAVKQIGYTSLGTIEFLVDKNKDFYFMEMNTRVQVEHPVTEMITGIDIIKEQLKIASGENLNYSQKDIIFTGHSMECRINAENPNKNFMPCPGKITGLHLPGGNGVRVDTAIYTDYTIPQNYDSMIAKVIVHGNDRGESIAKMKSALREFVIDGIDTNIEFLDKILNNENFITNNYDTSFIQKEF
jgi:acetyl-CoA carboxylase biotin carboxylase subunit